MTKANNNHVYNHANNPNNINLMGFPCNDKMFPDRCPFLNLELTNFN